MLRSAPNDKHFGAKLEFRLLVAGHLYVLSRYYHVQHLTVCDRLLPMWDVSKFLKSIPTWLSLFGLLAAMFGITKYVVHSETADLRMDIGIAKTDIAQLKDDVKTNHDDIGKTNDKIDRILSDVLNKAFPGTGVKPTRGTLEKAQKVITLAQTLNLKLEPTALANYGKTIAGLSEDPSLGPMAWGSLKQAMDYRSFLNKDFVPSPKDLTPFPPNHPYHPSGAFIPVHPGRSEVAIRVYIAGGYVNDENSARIELLSDPNTTSSGVGLFVIYGVSSAISLDGEYLKNVIVRDSHIVYKGGPVRLENVTFVNCTFTFTKSRPTISLGDAILQAAQVNFSTVAPA